MIFVIVFVACAAAGVLVGGVARWLQVGDQPTIRELRLRALSGLISNTSITVYEMESGREVRRRRPRVVRPLDGVAAAVEKLRNTVQAKLYAGLGDQVAKDFTDVFDRHR